jgi:hypothetical protein
MPGIFLLGVVSFVEYQVAHFKFHVCGWVCFLDINSSTCTPLCMILGGMCSFGPEISIHLQIKAGFTPDPNHLLQWYCSELSTFMSTGLSAIGGNKDSLSADPVFWCKFSES